MRTEKEGRLHPETLAAFTNGSFRKLGYLLWGPYNKDSTIWARVLY